MYSRARLPLLSVAVFLNSASFAADSDVWHGGADAGYTASAGNTRAVTTVVAARMEKKAGKLTHHLAIAGKNTEENGVRAAEAYRVTGKEDIALSGKNYVFVRGEWDKDRFGGYDWQLALAAGGGRHLIDTPDRQLSVEAGPGYRHDNLPLGATANTGLLRVALNYAQRVSVNTMCRQVLEADIGEDNTLAHSRSEIVVNVSDRLSLKAALDIERNSAPPAGSKNTDRTTTMSVGWTF